jgi:hypothetical protein
MTRSLLDLQTPHGNIFYMFNFFLANDNNFDLLSKLQTANKIILYRRKKIYIYIYVLYIYIYLFFFF